MEEKKENNMPAVSYVKMAKSIQPSFVENDRLDWIPAGENDKLFDELIEFSNYDGMHHAILQTKSNLVSGSRIEFKGSEKPNANESWEELSDKLASDLEIVGACAMEILPFSVAGTKMLNINHIPIQYLRYKKSVDGLPPTGMYYSRDWAKSKNNNKKYAPVFIPFYSENSKEKRQVKLIKKYWPGQNEYTIIPSYFAALDAIRTSKKISLFHLSNIENNMVVGLMLQFFGKKYNDPNQVKALMRKLEEKYKGEEKAGNVMVLFADDKDNATEIKQMETPDLDKMFDILSKEIETQILSSHQITNPQICGIKTPGELGGGGLQLLQAYELFLNFVINPDKNLLENGINSVTNNFGTEIKIINENATIKFAFSESLLQAVLSTEELREMLGYNNDKKQE